MRPHRQRGQQKNQLPVTSACAALFVSFLCSSLGRHFLVTSSSSEHVRHAVIAFITGVLKYGPCGLDERQFCFPWLGPGVRVLDREFILNRFFGSASESFGYFYVL